MRANVASAAFALLLFQLVGMASGRLDVHGGLGWDGEMYARMVTGRLSEGTANTAMRPLVILAVRIPYSLGIDVLRSFAIMNAIAAFCLYLVAAFVLERGGLDAVSRAVTVSNLALTISVSKMFGFYPALIDLGAMAIILIAFYLVLTDRFRLAAVACVFATASREFGIAASLFGIHRAIRLGRRREALLFLPSLLVPVLLRLPWLGTLPGGDAPLSPGRLATNLRMWAHPVFIVIFGYFALTVLGGITVLLVLRTRVVLARLRDEPELATFAAVVLAATAVGDADIPRYLVFILPVGLVLAAACLGELPMRPRLEVLVVMTLITLWTQRPLQAMTTDAYFMDWFPLYEIREGQTSAVVAVWGPRLLSLAALIAAGFLTVRHATRESVAPV